MKQALAPIPVPHVQRNTGDRGRGLKRPGWTRVAGIAAAVFGVATIASGAGTLFGPAEVQAAAGAIVYFVLWFNFLAGFAYLVGAYALFRGRPWALGAAFAIAVATALVALAFIVYTTAGGAFSWRTPGALLLRGGFWAAIVWGLWPRVAPRGGGNA